MIGTLDMRVPIFYYKNVRWRGGHFKKAIIKNNKKEEYYVTSKI